MEVLTSLGILSILARHLGGFLHFECGQNSEAPLEHSNCSHTLVVGGTGI